MGGTGFASAILRVFGSLITQGRSLADSLCLSDWGIPTVFRMLSIRLRSLMIDEYRISDAARMAKTVLYRAKATASECAPDV